jgi:hypothetical protein
MLAASLMVLARSSSRIAIHPESRFRKSHSAFGIPHSAFPLVV